MKRVFDINNIRHLMYEIIESPDNANKPRDTIKVSVPINSGITPYIKSRNIGN